MPFIWILSLGLLIMSSPDAFCATEEVAGVTISADKIEHPAQSKDVPTQTISLKGTAMVSHGRASLRCKNILIMVSKPCGHCAVTPVAAGDGGCDLKLNGKSIKKENIMVLIRAHEGEWSASSDGNEIKSSELQ